MSAKDSIIHTLSPGRKFLFAIITITCSIVISLWVANELLRFIEKHVAQEYPDYGDAVRKGGIGPGGLLKEGFEEQVHDGYGGTVRWKNNTQGFRHDLDFSQKPPGGGLRILSLGDSFTAGLRVDQADTFSKLLEIWSTGNLMPTEVLISMIEQPETGLRYLRKYGHTWSPQVVLLGITLGNDIAQAYVSRHPTSIGFRHGLEKLNIPDQCFVQRGWIERTADATVNWLRRTRLYIAIFNPSWPIKRWYHRKGEDDLKLFDANHGLGFYIKNPPQEIDQAYQRLFQILVEYQTFCAEENMTFAVLIFPQRFQIQPGDWQTTVAVYNLAPGAFDLMLPNKRIQEFCLRESITCVDPTDAMRRFHLESGKDLYMPRGDMHWNRYGHQAWFLGAQSSLESVLQTALHNHAIKFYPSVR